MNPINFGGATFDASIIDRLRRAEQRKYTEEYFREDYWKEDLPGQSGNRSLSYDDADHSARFSLLWHAIAQLAPTGSLVDVGCGPGHVVQRALEAGRKILGFDSSESAVKAFHTRTADAWPNAVVFAEARSLPMADRAVDVALCFDTLEHLIVFDIFAAVGELARVAGRRVIATINIDNPYTYHPTILSRSSWVSIFEGSGLLMLNAQATETITRSVCSKRPEYDFFVFDRI